MSYTYVRQVLQEAGIVEKEPGRGRYRRRRERRPMVGMLVHLDASTHEWIAGQPLQDLVVALDDADCRPYPGFGRQPIWLHIRRRSELLRCSLRT